MTTTMKAQESHMNITFIGVGAIGLPMALHIQRAGYQVTGVDVSEAVAANATANGVDTVRGLSEARRRDGDGGDAGAVGNFGWAYCRTHVGSGVGDHVHRRTVAGMGAGCEFVGGPELTSGALVGK